MKISERSDYDQELAKTISEEIIRDFLLLKNTYNILFV